MRHHEMRGHLVAEALAACSDLDQPSDEQERLWLAVRDAVCTRGLCLVTPLGSASSIPVTSDHSSVELIAAMEWLLSHEKEARQLPAMDLFIKLRGVATRGATGSARAAQADALHGLTHVTPGDPVVFTDIDPMEAAS
jgi:hypothetical protein